MANYAQEFLRYSPSDLVKLQQASSWCFDSAQVFFEGRKRTFPDVYQEAMRCVSSWGDGWVRAAQLFEFLVTDSIVFAEGHFQLGRIYLLQGRLSEALQLARNAVAMSPNNDAYAVLQIAALFVNGLEDEAAEYTRRFAHRKEKLVADVTDSLAVRRFFSNYMSLALPGYVLLENALVPVEAASASLLESLFSAKPGSIDCELSVLEEFIECNPNFCEMRFWLSELARRHGHTDRALRLCREAERRQVLSWPILVELGVLEWGQGNKRKALECFEDAALINESLPICAPEQLSSDSAHKLCEWYQDVLDRLPIKKGVYNGLWPFPPEPKLDQIRSKGGKPWLQLFRDTLTDISEGTQKFRVWWLLARNDVVARYRRTTLGPWWVVLGSGIALVGMASVWSIIFDVKMEGFFPYLSSGYVIWLLLNSLIVEGCTTFSDGQASAVQKSLNIPRFVHAYRLVARNFILFFHTLVIFLLGAIYYGVPITWYSLLVLPGLVIIFLNGLWISTLFGIVGARFRDFCPAVTAIMTVMFFVTPVLWKVEMLRDRGHVATFNPFTHLIAILREPLLGAPVAFVSWYIAIGLCMIGWIVTFLIYSKFRQRIIYWI